jgi:hypothetical protein
MLLSTLQGISADGKGAEILPLASGEFDAQKKLLSTIRKAGGKHGEKQFKELMILSNRGLAGPCAVLPGLRGDAQGTGRGHRGEAGGHRGEAGGHRGEAGEGARQEVVGNHRRID